MNSEQVIKKYYENRVPEETEISSEGRDRPRKTSTTTQAAQADL